MRMVLWSLVRLSNYRRFGLGQEASNQFRQGLVAGQITYTGLNEDEYSADVLDTRVTGQTIAGFRIIVSANRFRGYKDSFIY